MILWDFLNGKKTAISTVIFLGNLVFQVVNGGTVDAAELGAAVIGVIGLIHKAVKAGK